MQRNNDCRRKDYEQKLFWYLILIVSGYRMICQSPRVKARAKRLRKSKSLLNGPLHQKMNCLWAALYAYMSSV